MASRPSPLVGLVCVLTAALVMALPLSSAQILAADPTRVRIGFSGTTTVSTAATVTASYQATVGYLNQAASYALPAGKTFQLSALDIFGVGDATFGTGPSDTAKYDVWAALDAKAVDFALLSPSLYPCVQRQYGARPVASVVFISTFYPGDDFSKGIPSAYATFGTIVNTALTSGRPASALPQNASDVAGKVVGVINPYRSISAIQYVYDIQRQGISFWQAPAMVIIRANTKAQYLAQFFAGGIDIDVTASDTITTISNFVQSIGFNAMNGVGINILGPRVSIPFSPFLSSTSVAAASPGFIFVAMPWADPAVLLAVELAILNISASSGIGGTTYSNFIPVMDFTAMNNIETTLGILPPTGGACKRTSTDLFQDVYSLIQCPSGTFLKSQAEVRTSCANSTATCPPLPTLAVCVCKPCAVVPPSRFSVALSAFSPTWIARTAATNITGAACSKLAVCATVYQQDAVTITVQDWYGPVLRASLGLPLVGNISYQYVQAADALAAVFPAPVLIPASGSVGATWRFALPKPLGLGFWELIVFADGGVIDIAPTVIRGAPPACNSGLQATADGLCVCPDATAISGPRDPATCLPLYSIPAVIGGTGGAVVLLLLVGGIVSLWMAWDAADSSWRIAMKEIEIDDPPTIVGVGSFGFVVLGNYRGSRVALKRSVALHDLGRRSGSLASVAPAFHASPHGLSTFLASDPGPLLIDSPAYLSSPTGHGDADKAAHPDASPDFSPTATPLGSTHSTAVQLAAEDSRSDLDGGRALTFHDSATATMLGGSPGGAVGRTQALAQPQPQSQQPQAQTRRTRGSISGDMEAYILDVGLKKTPGKRRELFRGGRSESTAHSGALSVGNFSGGFGSGISLAVPEADEAAMLTEASHTVVVGGDRSGRNGRAAGGGEREDTGAQSVPQPTRKSPPGTAVNWAVSPLSPLKRLMKKGSVYASVAGSIATGSVASTRLSFTLGGALGLAANVFCLGGLLQHRARRLRLLEEIRRIISLRHPQVVTTMGAVVERSVEPILVMEYMSRGSLYDVLHNQTVVLDDQIVPIIIHCVQGLNYLHLANPPVLHNDIKSANILVDDDFNAKVSDFGLSSANATDLVGTPSWMAPELLRGDPPTTKTDIYAFGIMLWEIFARQDPYDDLSLNLLDVLDQVADASRQPPMRPTMPINVPPLFADLIRRCWSSDPVARPTFEQIAAELRSMDVPSITSALLARVRASDDAHSLLHSVFPPRVAKALREGRTVVPEHYDSVTLFFSDIVGFTDISGALPPEKVMNMLNRLYTAFDKLTVKLGLFKVETIGDAYMVAGNIPVAGQDWPCEDHAARIARFAMEAVVTANSVSVLEDDPSRGVVHIRVGFHSGPVVASVVGTSNPRYCLFGDTVNTSSRMESNSERDRIHLSTDAARLLLAQAPELGSHLESRGRITVKGKGEMDTLWLHIQPVPPSVAAVARTRVLASTGAVGRRRSNAVALTQPTQRHADFRTPSSSLSPDVRNAGPVDLVDLPV